MLCLLVASWDCWYCFVDFAFSEIFLCLVFIQQTLSLYWVLACHQGLYNLVEKNVYINMQCRIRAIRNIKRKCCKNLKMLTLSGGQGQEGSTGRGQGRLCGGGRMRGLITIELSLQRFLQVGKGTWAKAGKLGLCWQDTKDSSSTSWNGAESRGTRQEKDIGPDV